MNKPIELLFARARFVNCAGNLEAWPASQDLRASLSLARNQQINPWRIENAGDERTSSGF